MSAAAAAGGDGGSFLPFNNEQIFQINRELALLFIYPKRYNKQEDPVSFVNTKIQEVAKVIQKSPNTRFQDIGERLKCITVNNIQEISEKSDFLIQKCQIIQLLNKSDNLNKLMGDLLLIDKDETITTNNQKHQKIREIISEIRREYKGDILALYKIPIGETLLSRMKESPSLVTVLIELIPYCNPTTIQLLVEPILFSNLGLDPNQRKKITQLLIEQGADYTLDCEGPYQHQTIKQSIIEHLLNIFNGNPYGITPDSNSNKEKLFERPMWVDLPLLEEIFASGHIVSNSSDTDLDVKLLKMSFIPSSDGTTLEDKLPGLRNALVDYGADTVIFFNDLEEDEKKRLYDIVDRNDREELNREMQTEIGKYIPLAQRARTKANTENILKNLVGEKELIRLKKVVERNNKTELEKENPDHIELLQKPKRIYELAKERVKRKKQQIIAAMNPPDQSNQPYRGDAVQLAKLISSFCGESEDRLIGIECKYLRALERGEINPESERKKEIDQEVDEDSAGRTPRSIGLF